MYEKDEKDVTYPAGTLLQALRYKSSSSVLLTPLTVTFVSEATVRTNEAIREASRPDKCRVRPRCQACDESPPEPTLRSCPLYCTRADSTRNIICYSTAHTHSQLPSKAPDTAPPSPKVQTRADRHLVNSPASSWASQDTLHDMSFPLRTLPRVLSISSKAFRPPASFAAQRTFSSVSRRRSTGTAIPNPPKEEAEALSVGKTALATFLGTSKRLPEFSLAGKVILVSGAGRGLGLVQAEALLEAGATVYALDRLEQPDKNFAQIQKKAETELGTSLHYRRIDVRDVEGLNSIISDIAKKHNRLDGLIAAAGIQKELPALEYTAEDANTMFAVNITGCLMTAQATAKAMISTSTPGSIVFIGSMSGTIANRGLICPAYNASKAGVIQLARNLASEWGEHNIRVNTISPGYILTDMVEELFKQFPERRVEWPKQNMLGRVSSPREYRGAAVFLLSDASSFMTGSDLRMDGGHAAW